MRIDGIQLLEGSTIKNVTIDSGVSFPDLPNTGELFYRTDLSDLFAHNGTNWTRIVNEFGNAASASKLQNAKTINNVAFDGTSNISFTTSNISEGANLYFTNSRAAAASPVQSVFGKTGNVTLTNLDIVTGLGYTPVNKAGDVMTGNLTAPNFIGNLTGTASNATTAASVSGIIPISNGGTGASTAPQALTNLGAIPLAGGVTMTGPLGVVTLLEKVNIVTASPAATQNIDFSTASVWYFSIAQTLNTTLNFRGNSTTSLNNLMAVGQSISAVVLLTQGIIGFYPTAFQIDGIGVTPKWNGTAITFGNANSIDTYTITIIKTAAATFTLLASRAKFV